MKTDIKQVNVLAPKWWNPLFWLLVIFAPLLGILAGIVGGAFSGMLIGYESGLDVARRKMHKINEQMA